MSLRWRSDIIATIFGNLHQTLDPFKRPSDSMSDREYPPMDVISTEDAVHIWVDLPGVNENDINVFIRGDLLVIEGLKKSHYPAQERRVFLQVERQSTPFRRVFKLLAPIEEESIRSELVDGVLHISWNTY